MKHFVEPIDADPTFVDMLFKATRKRQKPFAKRAEGRERREKRRNTIARKREFLESGQ